MIKYFQYYRLHYPKMKKNIIKHIKALLFKLGLLISRTKKKGLNKNDAFKMQKYLIGEFNQAFTIFEVGAYVGVNLILQLNIQILGFRILIFLTQDITSKDKLKF